jgi:magnesium and cobalt exporter, CNNM family
VVDAEVIGQAVNQVGWDIVIVLAIVLIGGFFAGAEMALVSLREGQVRSLQQRGKRGQRAARLAQDPNRFLSAVQIGVTVATLLSGAFGAATLVGDLKTALIRHQVSAGWATAIAFLVVTGAISFFTLVLGELAPKRLALQRPESMSLLAAPLLDRISVLARPIVWLLSRCTNLVVQLLGGDPSVGRGVMTEEELRDLVAGTQALSADERHIVREVFDAGKRQLREVLVPRTEVEFIAASTPLDRAAKIAAAAPYSRFPVYQESYDDVIGFIHVRDLLDPGLAGRLTPVGEVCRPVKRLPTSKRVLSALSEMRRDRAHLAIVVDEYGGTAGIVTLEDLVEELIGEIQDEYDLEEGGLKQLHGGQLEVDGLLNLDEFAEQTGVNLPEGPYETVAGYVLATLGELPGVGAEVEVDAHRLTVTQLDGRRIARVRVGPAAQAGQAGEADQAGQAGTPGQVGQVGQVGPHHAGQPRQARAAQADTPGSPGSSGQVGAGSADSAGGAPGSTDKEPPEAGH